MPDLSRVARALSTNVRTTTGRIIPVLFAKPPEPLGRYDAEFIPRHRMLVDPRISVPVGTVIIDSQGVRFLCAPWVGEQYRSQVTAVQYVLFEVDCDAPWKRPASTVEPISGLAQPTADQDMGILPIALDAYRRKTDALEIDQEIYKALCVADVRVGDFLNGLRVRRVEHNSGVTYAQLL